MLVYRRVLNPLLSWEGYNTNSGDSFEGVAVISVVRHEVNLKEQLTLNGVSQFYISVEEMLGFEMTPSRCVVSKICYFYSFGDTIQF